MAVLIPRIISPVPKAFTETTKNVNYGSFIVRKGMILIIQDFGHLAGIMGKIFLDRHCEQYLGSYEGNK